MKEYVITMDFVTYKIGKKLQEKGYPHGYNRYGYRPIYFDECTIRYISDIGAYENGYYGENIPCPTINEALKWLREEKKIYIEIFLYNGKYCYFVKSITQICEDDLYHKCLNEDTTEEEYDTYEQAALAGIEYVLDNLI